MTRPTTRRRSAPPISVHHTEWMRLLEVSGPFLELPVLTKTFPQGLPPLDPGLRTGTRQRFDEWLADARRDRSIHNQWIRFVLQDLLEFPPEVLRDRTQISVRFDAQLPQHRAIVGPDFVVVETDGNDSAGHARLLIQVHPPEQNIQRPLPGETWKASPITRMIELLRAQDRPTRLGLVTNGGEWSLVHIQPGEATSFVTWQAELWGPEPLTLQAFRALLGAERTVGVAVQDRLEQLFERSASAAHELTDQLGIQVRQAVERLVKGIDEIDRARSRKLLTGFDEKRLYEAAVTVMMRLVFVFYAEESGLLPLDDPFYQAYYALSPLRDQLAAERDQLTDDVLHRRHAAWCRLLATFRAVYGGVEHEVMRLPAYGGALFDPDRFPFLEGRATTTHWRDSAANPLEIDDLTVLHLLESLQLVEVASAGRGKREKRPLSFRSLDVEQIGHLYEGLLDHTAVRARGPVLGLVGRYGVEPEVELERLETLAKRSVKDLSSYVAEVTGKSDKIVGKLRGLNPIDDDPDRWRRACDGDPELLRRLTPFAGFVREERGEPLVIPSGSVYVTKGQDRRSTGTHYTPRSLTEPIVEHALDPLVYAGPAEGKPEAEWQLRSPSEILALKVCDMAVGSGAFLVQACRYLADRLVESWAELESAHEGKVLVSPEGKLMVTSEAQRPVPKDDEERLAIARRAVADRCLYGVDVNEMAVEMAKLSLWLVTLQKNRPFTFLDHAIRTGDSLLGVSSVRQLTSFHLDPERGAVIHKWAAGGDKAMRRGLEAAMELRTRLEGFPVLDVKDAQRKEELLRQAQDLVGDLRLAADLLVGLALATTSERDFDDRLRTSHWDVARLLDPELEDGERVKVRANLIDERDKRLATEDGKARSPFHWVLEFPEVFLRHEGEAAGLSALVGNPPFVGGRKITGNSGTDYRDYLIKWIAGGQKGSSADLVAYFFLRGFGLLQEPGCMALLATNTVAQGDTREVGLDQIVGAGGKIVRAIKSRKWPGVASLEVAHVWVRRGAWQGVHSLDDQVVRGITPQLVMPGRVTGKPFRLRENEGKSFQGSIVLGMGFVLEPEEAQALISKDPRNKDVLFPYLNGEDLNSRPDQSPSRWVINFRDWPGERAREYRDVFRIVEEKVKPERQRVDEKGQLVLRKPLPQRWWNYADKRPKLYATIAGKKRVLVTARVSPSRCVAWVPATIVLHEKVVVFASESVAWFAVLTSSPHWLWAGQHTSTLGATTLNYAPSDCFETFPFPLSHDSLEAIGERYHSQRAACCRHFDEGLTKITNRFHDPDQPSPLLRELRELHVELDRQVLIAYDWSDLGLDHAFRGSGKDTRFTVSDPIRQEILDRLLELNHERYAEEPAAVGFALPRGSRKRGEPRDPGLLFPMD